MKITAFDTVNTTFNHSWRGIIRKKKKKHCFGFLSLKVKHEGDIASMFFFLRSREETENTLSMGRALQGCAVKGLHLLTSVERRSKE